PAPPGRPAAGRGPPACGRWRRTPLHACHSLLRSRPVDCSPHPPIPQGARSGMSPSHKHHRRSTIALLAGATLIAASSAACADAPAFVDRLHTHDKTLWRKSDGWANGWEKIDTGWVARHIAIAGGRMAITINDDGASGRRFASGE